MPGPDHVIGLRRPYSTTGCCHIKLSFAGQAKGAAALSTPLILQRFWPRSLAPREEYIRRTLVFAVNVTTPYSYARRAGVIEQHLWLEGVNRVRVRCCRASAIRSILWPNWRVAPPVDAVRSVTASERRCGVRGGFPVAGPPRSLRSRSLTAFFEVDGHCTIDRRCHVNKWQAQ